MTISEPPVARVDESRNTFLFGVFDFNLPAALLHGPVGGIKREQHVETVNAPASRLDSIRDAVVKVLAFYFQRFGVIELRYRYVAVPVGQLEFAERIVVRHESPTGQPGQRISWRRTSLCTVPLYGAPSSRCFSSRVLA